METIHKMKVKFNFQYFCLLIPVFLTEVFIAVYVRDAFVRPFVGDILAVILVYLFLRTFFINKKTNVIIGTLLFFYVMEIGQYFNILSLLNLENISVAEILMGSTFDVMDLLSYSVGALLLMIPDLFFPNKKILFHKK